MYKVKNIRIMKIYYLNFFILKVFLNIVLFINRNTNYDVFLYFILFLHFCLRIIYIMYVIIYIIRYLKILIIPHFIFYFIHFFALQLKIVAYYNAYS